MRSGEKQLRHKRAKTNQGHPPSDENISPKKLYPSNATRQRVPNPQAPQHTTNDPRKPQTEKEVKSRTERVIDRIKKFPVITLLSAVATLIIVISGVTGSLASIPDNLTKIWHEIHPDTTSPVVIATSTPIKNTCRGATGNNENITSYPVGFTFCIYHGHAKPVHAVAWSPEGKHIASGGEDGTVQIWDALTGGNVITYKGHKGSVNALAWSPNGQRIASGGDDGTVQIWLSDTASLVFTYGRGCCDSVTAIAWSPNGQFIIVGREDGNVNEFFADSGSNVLINGDNKAHTSFVTALAWSPDNNRFASASEDGTVKIWNNNTGDLEKTYSKPVIDFPLRVTALAWSPNGKSIAYAYDDGGNGGYGTVEVWLVTQGNEVNPVFDSDTAHITPTIFLVYSMSWACNSDYLALGEVIGNVSILDISSQRDIYSYTNHAKQVNAVAWSPDGTKIASGSDDGTVKVWQASKEIRCNA
jgi:WD40 repeat protein